MDPALNNALNQADVDRVLRLAVGHVDSTMRKYVWRGFRPKSTAWTELMVGDQTAEDFVQVALSRLCEGKRAYDAGRSLLENLNSVTDSLVWSAKQSSDRKGVIDFAEGVDEDGSSSDPVSNAIDAKPAADARLLQDELIADQRKCFEMLKASFDGEKEMQDYLDCLSERFFETTAISELTGIPPSKLYELRRKLKKNAPRFFGVKHYQELARKLLGGT